MHSLEKAKALAQRTANQDSKPVVILNLNPFSPLYVVREWSEGAEKSRSFVCKIEPV